MVVTLPEGILTMKTKRAILKVNTKKYKKSSKKEKTKILDDLSYITKYNRAYISRLLRTHNSKIKIKDTLYKCDISKTATSKRGRKKRYSATIDKYLYEIWKESGSISSKHMVAFIRENIEHIVELKGFNDITLRDIQLLLNISHSTIDRHLKDKKTKYHNKQKYRTNRGLNHIKSQIPVERYRDKIIKKPGYLEIDLVHHSGHNPSGEFLYTLSTVDVFSDWISLRILKNKARIWTCDAMDNIRLKLPFNLIHIHSDNGSEFINNHFLAYTKEQGHAFGFSRSKPYTKNDNPLVECKNWTVVRQYIGYRRYDTDKEMNIIKKLFQLIELKHNLFVPSMKIIYKKHSANKTYKKYSTKTPLKRLCDHTNISLKTKQYLINLKNSIDLYELNRKIKYYQIKLDKAYSYKRSFL